MFFIKILEEKNMKTNIATTKNILKTPNQRTFSPCIGVFYPIKYGMNTLKNDKISAGESRGGANLMGRKFGSLK